MEKRCLATQVQGLPLFAGVPKQQLCSFLEVLHGFVKHYSKADYVLLAGDSLNCLYILLSGSLEMINEDFLGNRTVIDGLGPGYVFTEPYFSSQTEPSSVSYLVASDSEILVLPMFKENLKEELAEMPMGSMIYNLLQFMATRNLQLIQKNEILAQKNLRGKLMAYLQQQAQEKHNETFTIPFNHTDLASYLDADRTAVARELTRMKKDGLIDYDKRTFTIKN